MNFESGPVASGGQELLLELAGKVHGATIADLCEKAGVTFRRSLADSVGVTVAAFRESYTRDLLSFGQIWKTSMGASVFGSGYFAREPEAAFLNSAVMHYLDFDDTGAFTQGHPSVAIIPAILAVGEPRGMTLESMILAYAVGLETLTRLSRALPMLHLKGWHPTSLFGGIAASAASSKLLGLDVEKTAAAMSLAASMGHGLAVNFGSPAKSLQVGKACGDGVLAALLAKSGFSASRKVLSTEGGFARAHFWGEPDRLQEQLDLFGRPWAVADPGVNIKMYPSCAMTHRLIDAALDARDEVSRANSEVREIVCLVPPRAKSILKHAIPRDPLEARFSIPFCVVEALLEGMVTLKSFEKAGVGSHERSGLMRRVRVEVHPDWVDGGDARADVLEITLENGVRISRSVELPRGNVKRALTADELALKVENCFDYGGYKHRFDEAMGIMNDLHSGDDISKLVEFLRQLGRES